MTSGARAWARLDLRFDDAATAHAVEAALQPENAPHCTVERDGPVLVVTVPEAMLGRVAETLDDLLACASAAERAQDAAGARPGV